MFVIEINNLSKIYGEKKTNSVQALDGVSFKVDDDEVLALIGTSGSGKSTFLNIVGGLDADYDGEVIVNGRDIQDFNPNYYRRYIVGTIFQKYYLVPTLNVAENILLPITFGRQLDKKEMNKRLDYLLERVGLSDRRKHRPNELSGGQAQRVAIARALIAKPQILLADEPTGNLDSKTGKSIVKLMRDLNDEENTTMIIVTHDITVVERIERKITLKDGKNV